MCHASVTLLEWKPVVSGLAQPLRELATEAFPDEGGVLPNPGEIKNDPGVFDPVHWTSVGNLGDEYLFVHPSDENSYYSPLSHPHEKLGRGGANVVDPRTFLRQSCPRKWTAPEELSFVTSRKPLCDSTLLWRTRMARTLHCKWVEA